jgi:S-formylglutathione hydrolase FrmB
MAGRFEEHLFVSEALRGNPLGDPHTRPLWVWLPPGYEDDAERRWPSVYVIQGLTGQIEMWHNRAPFKRTYPELVEELEPECVVIWVDAWTALGGSQFVDSPATGNYHTYLCDELVPWVDERYRTAPTPASRGIQGKSSGGYGAMITPLLRPDLFGGLATHAGDALFEHCYMPDFRAAARALRDDYVGSFERFWEDFHSRPPFSKGTDHALLNTYCMAACYSARDDGTIAFPFDLTTGELDDAVWAEWLEWDPVRMARKRPDAVAGLRAVYIDAGTSDEFYLDLGADAFHREVQAAGVGEVAFELFDGKHGNIDWRYPIALGWLAERLQP